LQPRDVYWPWRSLLLRKQVCLEHYRRGLLVKPETCAALGEKRILVRVKNACLNAPLAQSRHDNPCH
jgi:hypothetical protein